MESKLLEVTQPLLVNAASMSCARWRLLHHSLHPLHLPLPSSSLLPTRVNSLLHHSLHPLNLPLPSSSLLPIRVNSLLHHSLHP